MNSTILDVTVRRFPALLNTCRAVRADEQPEYAELWASAVIDEYRHILRKELRS